MVVLMAWCRRYQAYQLARHIRTGPMQQFRIALGERHAEKTLSGVFDPPTNRGAH